MTTSQQNQQIIEILKPYAPERIGIFGSWARDENGPESDLDILVRFGKTPGLIAFVGLQLAIEEALQVKVDLVSDRAVLNKRVRQSIDNDLKVIYQ